jgi:phosphoglucosamine mutase
LRRLFGTDGIRGLANGDQLNVDLCLKLAKAVYLKYCGDMSKKHSVIIGKDTRISGDMFEHALAAVFSSFGVGVKLLGVVPTPAISILVPKFQASVGIMISASHNPFHDNGIKLFNSSGLKLKDAEEEDLERIMDESTDYKKDFGRIESDISGLDFYLEKIKKSFSFKGAEKVKIILDLSNGSFSKIAHNLLKEFGFQVVSLHDSPNGMNINENCGATSPHILREAVLLHGGDIGISFDGDGDRLILADENGEILDGNHILAILTKFGETRQVVSTVMANFGLEKYLASAGIELIKTQVGDRYISEYMQANDVELGGEPSGHIIVKSHAPTGDGLYASLKVIDYMLKNQRECSQLRFFELSPSFSRNLQVPNKSVVEHQSVKELINKTEKQLQGRGKLIVRPSGTESVIRISVEGKNTNELQDIVNEISNLMLSLRLNNDKF